MGSLPLQQGTFYVAENMQEMAGHFEASTMEFGGDEHQKFNWLQAGVAGCVEASFSTQKFKGNVVGGWCLQVVNSQHSQLQETQENNIKRT